MRNSSRMPPMCFTRSVKKFTLWEAIGIINLQEVKVHQFLQEDLEPFHAAVGLKQKVNV